DDVTVEDPGSVPVDDAYVEINGVAVADWTITGDVQAIDACTLTFETFNIGDADAFVDIAGYGSGAFTPLVADQQLNSDNDPVGSNGTWTFDLRDHRALAPPSARGYQLAVEIERVDVAGSPSPWGEVDFAMPAECVSATPEPDPDPDPAPS